MEFSNSVVLQDSTRRINAPQKRATKLGAICSFGRDSK